MHEPGRSLRLDDAARIAAGLRESGFAPSEHRFANLWLFRARHRYRLVEKPFPHIRGITYDGATHVLPLSGFDAAGLRRLAADGVDCLYPLDAEIAGLAARIGSVPTHDPADSDYWFRGSDMAILSGAGMRRAQARRFAEEEAPVWLNYTPALASDALAVLDGWAADVARPASRTDAAECREAISLAAVLELEGGVVRTTAGEPVAFLLASRAGNARVVHFAKGRRAHSHAYPWMFARYAATSGAAWLNFEQDLGNAGLAQSKRAYAPARVEPKFRLGLVGLR